MNALPRQLASHLETARNVLLNRWLASCAEVIRNTPSDSETPLEYHERGLESLLSLVLRDLTGDGNTGQSMDYLQVLVSKGFLSEYAVNRLVMIFQLLEKLLVAEIREFSGKDSEVATTGTDVVHEATGRIILACCRFYEERVSQSGGRFEELLEKSSLINFYLDTRGKILKINAAAADTLLADPADVTGRNFVQFVPPGDLPLFTRMLGFVLQGNPQMFEMPVCFGKEGVRYLSMNLHPVFAEGKTAGVRIMASDATEERMLQQRLSQSEEKYRKLIENANDAILLFRLQDGKIVDSNFQAMELTGYRRRELAGKSIPQLFDDEDRRQAIALIQDTISEGSSTYDGMTLKTRSGKQLVVEISSNVIEYGDTKVIQSIVRDMTRRYQLEKKLQERTRELEETHRKVQAIQQHQLRIETSLILDTVVLPFVQDSSQRFSRQVVQLGAIGKEVGEIRKKFTERILETCGKDASEEFVSLMELVTRDLERCQEDAAGLRRLGSRLVPKRKPSVRQVEVSLNEVVERILDLQSFRIGPRVTLNMTLGEVSPIPADPVMVEQAVYLACRATLTRVGDWGRIQVETRRTEDYVLVIFSDNAGALTQEHMRKILDPYAVTPVFETGFHHDLMLCHKVLSWMGGALTLDQVSSHDNRVVLEVPLEPLENPRMPQPENLQYDLLVVEKDRS